MTVRVKVHGWGMVPVAYGTICDYSQIEDGIVQPSPRGATPRGAGRSYGDAAVNSGGLMVATGTLDFFHVNTSNGLATLGAGLTLGEVTARARPLAWRLPVTPGTRHVTVGGAVAADVHGKNHVRAGSFGDWVRSLVVLTGDGSTVELHPDAEEFWATVGGMGLTGLVLRCTVQLEPSEQPVLEVRKLRHARWSAVVEAMRDAASETVHSIAWIDGSAPPEAMGRGVVSTAVDAGPGTRVPAVRGLGAPRVPVTPPVSPINRLTTALFDRGLFHSARSESETTMHEDAFHYPLDAVGDWNRLYGRGGMIQYQFAVPEDGLDVIESILGEMAVRKQWSPLVTLKRLGEGNRFLSFPIPGWTLAVDFPASAPGLAPLLDDWDRLVAERGGRVYLAKDGRARADVVGDMYPELGRWREVRDRMDPEAVWTSDLDRRLRLSGRHA